MTNRVFVSALVVLAALLTASSISAHHSFSPLFDGENAINLTGVVTRFEWSNPHTFIVVDVKNAAGKSEQWALEGPAPNGLTRVGWSPDSIKPGQTIEACGYGLRDSALKIDPKSGVSRRVMMVEVLTLPDGRTRLWLDYGQKRRCRETQGQNVLEDRFASPKVD